MSIKKSAIPYAGYQYQTLQGVKILADWLDSPTKYVRIAFEADSEPDEVPRGIDDIVCERRDGKTDFWQVKFTPDADKEDNQLTWVWLLKQNGKTSRARSILQKIADAIEQVSEEKRGDVVLLTNKVPDRELEASLNQSQIDFGRVADVQRQEIIRQLGSQERAERLFSILQVHHSDQNYKRLNINIHEKLRKLTNEEGIYRLIHRATNWAILKNSPSEGGWIHLEHIRSVISLNRPEPIPQSFEVPENYIVPDESFHNDFIEQLRSGKDSIVVLTGSPGKGKSTYLSYICQSLEKQQFPYIRHHYFLSSTDRTLDRLSPRIVAEDLMSQIAAFCPEINVDALKPEDLYVVLTQCGQLYQSKSSRFFVVIDGLDHVWRDNDKDTSPLNELFLQLIPVPENVTLIIGTQPVEDELLPSRLLNACPRENWCHLPAMTGNAIRHYLAGQVKSGRLQFVYQNGLEEEELSRCAELLTTVTQGYPLHVIYSCEQLHVRGEGLTTWQIEQLPRCEGGNIASYYQTLWRHLSYSQRDVLHLCCAFPFLWPASAFTDILNEHSGDTRSLNAVIHLLYESIAGLRPFHESLIVFTCSTAEHNERISALLPAVINWIATSAPENIRTCWHWHCIARTGDSEPLRGGINRNWVLERLAEGYQPSEFTRLLSQAESIAFTEQNFPEAYQHRSLKTRLYNVWLQIWAMPTLNVCSIACAPTALFNQYLSTRNTSTPKELATLSIAAWFRSKQEDAAILAKLALRRYSSESSTYTDRNTDETRANIHLLIKAGVLGEQFNEEWLNTSSVNEWDDGYIALLIDMAEFKADLNLLFALHRFLSSITMKAKVEQAMVRVGIVENIDLIRWPQFADFNRGYAALYKQLLNTRPVSLTIEQGENEAGYCVNVQTSYEEWFYESLLFRLTAEGSFSWLPVKAQENRSDTSIYYYYLNHFADLIAENFIQNTYSGFSDFCELTSMLDSIGQLKFEEQRNHISFQIAWVGIALNLHALIHRKLINTVEINHAIGNNPTRLHWVRKKIFECQSRVVENKAIEKLIQLDQIEQAAFIEVTNDRIERNIELADIALRYDLDKSLILSLTKLCWDYGLGYGYHKDIALNSALEAIDCLANVAPTVALPILERLSPIVNNICDFTDGDHTRHAVTDFSTICAKIAVPTLVSIYDDYVSRGEWYDADNALDSYLDNADLSSPFVQALCRTLLNVKQIRAVRKRIKNGYPHTLLNELWRIPIPEDDEKTEEEQESKFDPNTIHPQNIGQLFSTASLSYEDVSKWYQYWKEHGAEAELVTNLLPIVQQGLPEHSNIRNLLDPLFDDTLQLKGKKQAYSVLVQGHIHKNGWVEWWGESDKKTYARLDKLIKYYPDSIDDFVQRTTQQVNSRTKDNKLIIPGQRLVYLLANSGRVTEAEAFCLAMVTILEKETQNLPLKKPDGWVWSNKGDKDSLAIKLLIRRLFWPVLSVKHHTAEQLAKLLTSGLRADDIEKQLVLELSAKQLESDVVDILTVFWLASLKGYQVKENISAAVKARSILSDILLASVLPSGYANQSQYRKPQHQLPNGIHDYGFEKIQGNELPRIFLSQMRELEDDTGIPASSFFRNAWIELCQTQEQRWESVDYFFNSGRRTFTGSFATKNTRFGISAYLRTLNKLHQEYGMPNDCAVRYMGCAMMADPVFYAVSNSKPVWVEAWPYGTDVTEENLRQYIKVCQTAFDEATDGTGLGSLSLPVYVDENTWFDISLVLATKTAQTPVSFEIQSKDCGFNFGYLLQPFISIKPEFLRWAVYHSCRPLFGDSTPLMYASRVARWDLEYFNRGIFAPLCEKEIFMRPGENCCTFMHEGEVIGHSNYWQALPFSSYPKEIRSPVATYTAYGSNKLHNWLGEDVLSQPQIILCDVTVLKRKYSYEDFSITAIRFCIE